MIASIADAQQSANVLGAYKQASNALRQTNTAAGITVDTVHDALDDVRDALDDHNEIQQALGDAKFDNANTNVADDGDLEAELAELLAADTESEAAEAVRKDDELNASIERRLKQLNISSGFADLSAAEQQEILDKSVAGEGRVAEEAK